MANLDHESIGDTIGRSVATALVMHSKEKTGSYIPTEEAKHLKSDLEVHERESYKASIINKATLVDRRVQDVMAIKYEDHERPRNRATL